MAKASDLGEENFEVNHSIAAVIMNQRQQHCTVHSDDEPRELILSTQNGLKNYKMALTIFATLKYNNSSLL